MYRTASQYITARVRSCNAGYTVAGYTVAGYTVAGYTVADTGTRLIAAWIDSATKRHLGRGRDEA